jgi:acetyl-CoA carboxylase biotin carboxyl carrier protein
MAATRQDGGAADGESTADASRNGAANHENPILIDVELVQQLIQAVDGSGIDTLEISRAGMRIRISKSPAVTVTGPIAAAPAVAAMATAAPAPASASPAPAPQPAEEAAQSRYKEIKSPMVGTFYRAPAPEAPPYVEIGSTVSRGQTLCILEAMKLMNELESEVDGVVREILAENSDPVEYGQVLFRIEPVGGA